jgi:predicted nuclease with TOPRIM domain
MKNQLQERLQQLRSEYEAGQKMLVDLESKQMSLRETLLRISGAMQVLEELLGEDPEQVEDGDRTSATTESVDIP